MKYQIYFRIRRGGIGIPYTLAKTEFQAVFQPHIHRIEREHSNRRRMWIDSPLTPNQVAGLAQNLGYTTAILQMHAEPYCGETLCPTWNGRWYTGWVRQGEWKVYQTEVYVQDEELLLKDAPDRRRFEIERNGERHFAAGHYAQRAMSSLDARFLFNIAHLTPTMHILDPFAGFGGIVFEAKRRGLTIFASDNDPSLSPGLAQLAPEHFLIADARALPFPSNHFDSVITEPPFRNPNRQAVMDSLTELHRVLKPTGQIVLLIAIDMLEAIQHTLAGIGKPVQLVEVIPRGGGLKSPVLMG
jgi:SAM-dependent methyltransferase